MDQTTLAFGRGPTLRPAPAKILYFAYGPNMNPVQMNERCSRPRAVAVARLAGHALTFHGHGWIWDGGRETVVPAPGHDLWGVVYELTARDADSLDAWQDVMLNGTGSYFHCPAIVVDRDGCPYETVLYKKDILGAPRPPSNELLAFIVEGAAGHGLPRHYVEELCAIPGIPAAYPVPRRRDEDRDALRSTSCPDCTSMLDENGRLIE